MVLRAWSQVPSLLSSKTAGTFSNNSGCSLSREFEGSRNFSETVSSRNVLTYVEALVFMLAASTTTFGSVTKRKYAAALSSYMSCRFEAAQWAEKAQWQHMGQKKERHPSALGPLWRADPGSSSASKKWAAFDKAWKNQVNGDNINTKEYFTWIIMLRCSCSLHQDATVHSSILRPRDRLPPAQLDIAFLHPHLCGKPQRDMRCADHICRRRFPQANGHSTHVKGLGSARETLQGHLSGHPLWETARHLWRSSSFATFFSFCCCSPALPLPPLPTSSPASVLVSPSTSFPRLAHFDIDSFPYCKSPLTTLPGLIFA